MKEVEKNKRVPDSHEKERIVIVKHAPGTSEDSSPSKSWISFWEENTKCKIPQRCPCCNCIITEKNPAEGAHVFKVIDVCSPPRQKYIVPTCQKCNLKYKGNKADEGVFIVPASFLCKIPD